MQSSSNRFVLAQCLQWLKKGYQPFLATVVKTYGSSPRPQGSLMAWCAEEGIVGSLSGGCIEEALIEQLNTQTITTPSLITYGKTPEEQTRLQLPCGGHLQVWLEQLTQNDKTHFDQLLENLKQGKSTGRQVGINSGEFSIVEIQTTQLSNTHWQHRLTPDFHLLLIGAGEVSRCVAELAQKLEFAVSLCDYRETFLQGWQVPGVTIYKSMPDDLIRESFAHNHCAILCLAHDPRLDDMALMQALKTDAFYVGAMGSKVSTQKRKERLTQLEISPQQIEKLHAPIGINIPSKTPYEIAISIMAELIQAKAK